MTTTTPASRPRAARIALLLALLAASANTTKCNPTFGSTALGRLADIREDPLPEEGVAEVEFNPKFASSKSELAKTFGLCWNQADCKPGETCNSKHHCEDPNRCQPQPCMATALPVNFTGNASATGLRFVPPAPSAPGVTLLSNTLYPTNASYNVAGDVVVCPGASRGYSCAGRAITAQLFADAGNFFFYIYRGAFNPAQPLANLVAVASASRDPAVAKLEVITYLGAGKYVFVVATDPGAATGVYTLRVSPGYLAL